jgi:hypothetical protein
MLIEGQALGNLILDDAPSTALVPPEPRLVSMLDAWNVPMADRRDLYRAIADAIPDSPARNQRFTLLLVDSYKDPVSVHYGIRLIMAFVVKEHAYLTFTLLVIRRHKWTNKD